MARRPQADLLIAFAMVIATALAGCGGSSKASASDSTSTTVQSSAVTASSERPDPALTRRHRKRAADIVLSSPAMTQVAGEGLTLSREFTCDGAGRSPAFRWRGIPTNADEVTLFVVSARPINHKLFFDWAVAGLSPKLSGLEAGHLPSGAIVGRNGFGRTAYSICPSGSAPESYFFELSAPTKRTSAQTGFEPLTVRNQADQSSHGTGLLIASYTRR
jgi:phosphatidylethanolamine-binding protein (PEBP) family uncharacterized protein